MVNQLIPTLFRHHEGRIAIAGSIIYSVIGWLAKFQPTLIPLSEFTTFLCRFMPIPLFLFYIKMGAFKSGYRSSPFNVAIMLMVLTLPFTFRAVALLK